MSYRFGNKIITDGLIFYLDAANQSSYKPGNTKWKSIAKDVSSGTLAGDTYYQMVYDRKVLTFDGSDDFVSGKMGPEGLLDIYKTGTIVVQYFFSFDTYQSKKTIFCAGSNGSSSQYGVGVGENGGPNIVAYISNHNSEQSVDTGIKKEKPYYLLTINFGSSAKIYLDALEIGYHSLSYDIMPGDYWKVGTDAAGGPGYNGSLNAIMIYNRELSLEEIRKNYDFLILRP